ncbi:MAG: hypothetical protein DESF_01283 [Desulfovibrio sp.]
MTEKHPAGGILPETIPGCNLSGGHAAPARGPARAAQQQGAHMPKRKT